MKSKIRLGLHRLHRLLCHFGIDPITFFKGLISVPRYFNDLQRFARCFEGRLTLSPCLHDRYQGSGSFDAEYFMQDLVVARWIHVAKPRRHVDVGSRIDGFVAHVASFMPVSVLDIRPPPGKIPGIEFVQLDLCDTHAVDAYLSQTGYAESLSCLHALEHFGLGRYGDQLDSAGPDKGFVALASLLAPGGVLYLGVPVGVERVEFNAGWVLSPRKIMVLARQSGLNLQRLVTIEPGTGVVVERDGTCQQVLSEIEESHYLLAIFEFIRPA